jgi:hypothetical protein
VGQDRRIEFARKWWVQAGAEQDPFDRFFCLWISLIVAARRKIEEECIATERDNDAGLVKAYFVANAGAISGAVSRHARDLRAVAARRGSTHGDPIVDTPNLRLREMFRQLSGHLSGRATLPPESVAASVAELFNQIRNNLFHGRKLYDDREDIKLLTEINPVLCNILEGCEGFRPQPVVSI